MAKITKFQQGVVLYYDEALNKIEKGDYVGALEFLRLAQSTTAMPFSDDDLALRLEIAELYADMELYDESNKEYFKMTMFDYCPDEVFYGIIRNFVFMEMPELAAYYLNLAIELDVLGDDEGFMPVDMSVFFDDAPKLSLVKPPSGDEILPIARQLIANNQPEFAKQMLDSVKPESPNYKDALIYKSVMAMSENQVENALNLSNEALSIDPDDTNAMATQSIALKLNGRLNEAETLLKQIDLETIKNYSDAMRLAMCASELDCANLLKQFTEVALKFEIYSRDALILNALANCRLGQVNAAKDAIIKVLTLYPDDAEGAYFSKIINNAINEVDGATSEKLPISITIDTAILTEWENILYKTIGSSKSSASLIKLYNEDKNIKFIFDWAMHCGNYVLMTKASTALCRTKAGYLLVKDLLLDPDYPVSVKKAIFTEVLLHQSANILQLVVNYRLKWLRPVLPKITKNKTFINAFYLCYSALSFIDEDFDKRLSVWYKKVVTALDGIEIPLEKSSAVAAVIAYKSKINIIFSETSHALEVFNCSEDDFMLYCNIYDQKQKKPPKSKSIGGGNTKKAKLTKI